MSHVRCKLDLGNSRYLQVLDCKGEVSIDLIEWKDDKPTDKGIKFTLMRWVWWILNLEVAEHALRNNEPYELHLGGNVYCRVQQDSIDVRQYWKSRDQMVPTQKGLRLRHCEIKRLREVLPEVRANVPELSGVEPCVFQRDHLTDLGTSQCPECNPDDYMNW